MYRCYLICGGRIAKGDDLDVDTLDDAILSGRMLLATQPQADCFTGIEIWLGTSLLYSDKCHADDAGCHVPVVSPFQTGESTLFSTWRPSFARPLLMKEPNDPAGYDSLKQAKRGIAPELSPR